MLVRRVLDVGEHANLRSHDLLAVGAPEDLIRGELGVDGARASALHDQRALAQVGREGDEGEPREPTLVGHDDVGHEPGRHGHVQVRQEEAQGSRSGGCVLGRRHQKGDGKTRREPRQGDRGREHEPGAQPSGCALPRRCP